MKEGGAVPRRHTVTDARQRRSRRATRAVQRTQARPAVASRQKEGSRQKWK